MIYTIEQQREHRGDLVKVLRSEHYNQIELFLHSDEGFDVMGVACDISGLAEWIPAGYYREDPLDMTLPKIPYYRYGTSHTVATLPIKVMEYYGFGSGVGDFLAEATQDGNWWRSLSGMNDEGVSFDILADIIEDEPESLFTDWYEKQKELRRV